MARPNRLYRTLGALLGPSERADPSLTLDQWASFFSFQGTQYPFMQLNTTGVGNKEAITRSFTAYVQMAYRSNGPVFACMLLRSSIFSEARAAFRRRKNGRPGDLFTTSDLAILETPWSGATTGDLLARAIQDIDLAGNFFCVRDGDQLRRLQPDWVTIVAGSHDDFESEASIEDLGTELVGYTYQPGGPRGNKPLITLLPEEVCHFAPIPDPIFRFRGMPWIEPIVREVMGDTAATSHKLAFFDNAATPNLAVSFDPSFTKKAFDEFKEAMDKGHQGVANAYKTLYFGGGATVTPIGMNFRQMDFKITQGAGESRIAAAAGCPPILVGFSEGLASGTYSNYGQAVRRFADGTMRPLWRNFFGSMQRIITMPGGAELWYDDRDIAFLREDQKDAAIVLQTNAATISSLVNAGFVPDDVIAAVTAGDLSVLSGNHTGLYSVQLQPPGLLGEPGGPDSEPDPNDPADAQGEDAPVITTKPTPKLASAQILAPYLIEHSNGHNGHAEEPVVVHIHQAPVNVTSPDVTVEPAQVTVSGPVRMVRETTFIKDEAGEIIGSRETEREADDEPI
jgi:phage portal protein BeeE